MRRAVVAGVAALAAVVVVSSGYVIVQDQGRAALRSTTDRINASLRPGGSFSYAKSTVHPFARSADLSSVTLRLADGTLWTARHVHVSGAVGDRVGSFLAEDLHGTSPAEEAVVTASSLDGVDVVLPQTAVGSTVDPAAITFDRMTLNGMSVTYAQGVATAASASMLDYGRGRTSTLRFRDVTSPFQDPPYADRLSIGELDASGIDIASAVDAARRGVSSHQAAATPVTLSMDDFRLGLGPATPFAIRRMTVSGSFGQVGDDQKTSLSISGISYAPADSSERGQLQESIGQDKVSGSLSLVASYVAAGGVLEISPLTLSGDGLGSIGIDLKLSSLDASLLADGHPDIGRLMTLASETKLAGATAFLQDDGLLDRASAVQAAKQGLPVGDVRGRAAAAILSDQSVTSLPGGAETARAISDFALYGGRLQVVLAPPAPLGIAALIGMSQTDPTGAVSALGMTVTRTGTRAPGRSR